MRGAKHRACARCGHLVTGIGARWFKRRAYCAPCFRARLKEWIAKEPPNGPALEPKEPPNGPALEPRMELRMEMSREKPEGGT